MSGYPINRTHRQLLEDAVHQPWITRGTAKGWLASTCELTGGTIRRGATIYCVQDVGCFLRIPTDDEVREIARDRLAELDRLGIP